VLDVTPRRVLLASRNEHKVSEIRDLLEGLSIELVSLVDAGVEEDPAEDAIERYDTFEANALAKAAWFHGVTGLPTLADDSGICVDALGGGPGVRSRRFAPVSGSEDQDLANNRHLLASLDGVPEGERGAHYLCALALIDDTCQLVVFGRVDGRIAEAERGSGGFGYDPLFVPAGYEQTFGELPPEVKSEHSHRAAAVRGMRPWLR
jgi:XTP/dITP diphosphohydrolase